MTQHKNIHILGAGIMGLMSAYMLAKKHKITIHDPAGFPAKNASLMAGGMLAPYSEIEHMDMEWVDAGQESIEIWKSIPLKTGLAQNGSLLVAHSDDRYTLERFKTHLPNDLKTPQNVSALEKDLSKSFETGIFLKDEAHLDPYQTMTALCNDLCARSNVKLKTVPLSNAHDSTVIDCRGIAANEPDLRGVKGETLLVRNPDFKLSRPVRLMHPRYPLYIIPRKNNIFMIGATVIESADNNAVSLRSSMELMSALYALSPSFADAEIIEIKAGIRPSYPDNLPRITIKNNTISCNGLFRHGYLLAPIMAECVAAHLDGKTHNKMHLFTKGPSDENHNQRAA